MLFRQTGHLSQQQVLSACVRYPLCAMQMYPSDADFYTRIIPFPFSLQIEEVVQYLRRSITSPVSLKIYSFKLNFYISVLTLICLSVYSRCATNLYPDGTGKMRTEWMCLWRLSILIKG